MSASTRQQLCFLLLFILAICASLFVSARSADGDRTGAGTVIFNQAEGTYEDDSGVTHSTVSPVVTIKVLAIAKLTTTPDETNPSAEVGPNDRISRTFRICNAGNVPDLYKITHVDITSPAALVNLYYDLDANGTVTSADELIGLNQTLSPRVNPGDCVGVLVVADTKDFPAKNNLTIHLTARSNVENAANGITEDDGTIINAVGAAPRLTNPNDANLPPSKLVNGVVQVVTAAGVPVTYTISFRNSGETPAREITVIDDLPYQLNYLPGSLRLGDKGLTDADDTDEGSIHGRQLKIH